MQMRTFLLAGAIGTAAAACGSESPSAPEREQPSALECEARGYPCSLSEVPLVVLERSDALGDEGLAMLKAGASTAEVAAWLEGQPDVAEVEWDETAIWFRPEGGTGIWILGQGTLAPEFVRPAASPQSRGLLRSALHVVGPGSEKKNALVLSPFHWAVPEIEDTPTVAAILAATRGFEHRVTYLANPEETSSTVSLESFMNWDDYQVIHISTHGKRICTATRCRATLAAGTLTPLLPSGPESKAQKLQSLEQPGLGWAKGVETDEDVLVVNADFFRHRYEGGLENALVYLNACQVYGPEATDLVDAIRGSTSMVFGWTERVFVKDATAAAVALYDALSDGGYSAGVALDKIGALKVGDPVEGEPSPVLRLSQREEGGDLRIREVVTLLHPSSGDVLTAGDLLAINGTQSDGTPDAVPVLVRVDGITPDVAADLIVHVSIDGVEADPIPLAGAPMDDEDHWTVSGILPLGYDLIEERAVAFRAWVDLPSGGQSRHETGATLTGDEPIMGRVWEMEAVHTSGWTAASGVPHTPYTATARLTLSFAPDQSAAEPNPRYIVTDGTVTFDYNHTYYNCTTTAPVLTFDVTEEVSGESELRFDTTVQPARYSGLLSTAGPEFEVTTTCEDTGTRTHRATNTWLLLEPGDALQVSSGGRSITGTRRVENSVGFYIQVDYTITRTE